jgi:hypothetical protein
LHPVLEKFLKSVGAITIALVAVYYVFSSLEYWFFSVSALIAWTVAEFVYELLNLEKPTEWIGFLIYSLVIIGASALGVWVVQEVIPDLLNPTQQATSSVDLSTLIFYSIIAGVIAYSLPNLPDLMDYARETIDQTDY